MIEHDARPSCRGASAANMLESCCHLEVQGSIRGYIVLCGECVLGRV